MSGQFGAYVTVRYWCPSLFNHTDVKGIVPADQMVREIIESEGVLGIEDGHEIIAIEIKERP